MVVAESEAIAEEAVELVDVEYDELPAVMDTTAALADGAPQVHETFHPIAPELRPEEGTNICHHSILARGDIEEGFRQADFVYEDTYTAPPVQHCALDLHACIASVEDGKITAPVKGATLVGNGPESLKDVTMIGNDMRLDSGVGVCGKEGQSVPVGVGQPTLRIENMTVGGTA